MKMLIRSFAVVVAAVTAGPAIAWNDRPPANDDVVPRQTWTFDLPAEQPVPHDDTVYAVAPREGARAASGVAVSMIALPVGDGSPGDELGAVASKLETKTTAASKRSVSQHACKCS